MEISITARNIDMNDSLKQYVHKKISKFNNIYKRIYKCDVVLDSEKERKNAEIILSLKRSKLVAKESSIDIVAAVDIVVDKIKKQLRRMNGKIASKRRKKIIKRIVDPVSNLPWFGNHIAEDQ